MTVTTTSAWQELERHHAAIKDATLASIILNDAQRLEQCSLALDGLSINYALNFVTPETVTLLVKLARECKVEEWRAKMMRGEKINTTENRAALHVALRQQNDTPILVDGHDILGDIRTTRQRIAQFVAAVRGGIFLGATGRPIRHVVNIGIGGSDLGPRMAAHALSLSATQVKAHFVANVDAFELSELFKQLDPAETLFVIVSKTFTTQETLLNARAARAWLVERLGEKAVAQHFVAISTNIEAIKSFGIGAERIFPMWDWVGGRFSLWSAVGLTVELAIGTNNFEKLLQGAAAIDAHFVSAPLEKNIPVLMAMLGIWSRNFLGCAAHAVLPYNQRLSELPRYLQQLEMESNGKSIGRDGLPVDIATTPLLFGETGTVGQHGFHQWLHQSTDPVSADFIAVSHDDFGRADAHQALLSNLVAQASALAFGRPQAAVPQDIYFGNRGSTIITLARLDPYHLGMLLALYEHKVFVQSVIWGINPFDQPGVELGKRMARALAEGAAASEPGDKFAAQLYAKISQ